MKLLTKNINGKEVEISITSTLPSGHGHYKIKGEAYISGSAMSGAQRLEISYTTSNMMCIDAYKGEDDDASDEAEAQLLEHLYSENEAEIAGWLTEKEYIVAFDSGARGTRYVHENSDTGVREAAMRFGSEEEAEEYMANNEHVGWVEEL